MQLSSNQSGSLVLDLLDLPGDCHNASITTAQLQSISILLIFCDVIVDKIYEFFTIEQIKFMAIETLSVYLQTNCLKQSKEN